MPEHEIKIKLENNLNKHLSLVSMQCFYKHLHSAGLGKHNHSLKPFGRNRKPRTAGV